MAETAPRLHSGFLRSAEAFPDRPALEAAGTVLRYGGLRERAAVLAATLMRWSPVVGGPPLTGVFAYRSVTAFAGVLAALFRGHGYVPLNPTFPSARTRLMLERAGCRAVIVDSESEKQLDQVLVGIQERLLLLLPERSEVGSLARRWQQHIVLGADDLEPSRSWQPVPVSPESIAYLLFTSGSTGIPKGVMASHRNVTHLIDVMVERYGITEEDRFSQTFDMTFDLSAFDMFAAWERGACLSCPSRKTLLNPSKFIQESRLTVWFSVPSMALLMRRLGALKPGRYPTLRWSLFCGEPLPVEMAEAWSAAAPNSVVENLYGPTELTIACSAYRWGPGRSRQQGEFGIVPIGQPFSGMEALVVDDELKEVPEGAAGELLMTGPQLTLGYWQDSERTAAAFVTLPGKDKVYYRTGDRVRKPLGDDALIFLGRLDHQIKVQGYRVELAEVEVYLRQEAGVERAAALGWPLTPSGAGGIVAFVENVQGDAEEIRVRLRTKLPPYAVPREIRFLPELPLNPNGKLNRRALLEILETQA